MLKVNIDSVNLLKAQKSSAGTALGCQNALYETAVEETFCTFLRFKENMMLWR